MATATRTAVSFPDDNPWMTLQQAAVYIGTSVKTVRRLIAARHVPAYVCGARGLRVRRKDLDDLMKPI